MVLQAASAALWSPALGPPVGCRAAAALVALDAAASRDNERWRELCAECVSFEFDDPAVVGRESILSALEGRAAAMAAIKVMLPFLLLRLCLRPPGRFEFSDDPLRGGCGLTASSLTLDSS